jgi:hypothetical protein
VEKCKKYTADRKHDNDRVCLTCPSLTVDYKTSDVELSVVMITNENSENLVTKSTHEVEAFDSFKNTPLFCTITFLDAPTCAVYE